MSLRNEWIACICEGAFERSVMEVLLDADCLSFGWDDLLEGDLIELRSSRRFSQRYLNREYDHSIRIIRILDSRSERFEIAEIYQAKLSRIESFYTRPEIEVLVILIEDCYDDYVRNHHHLKPSDYCKMKFGYRDIKKETFVKDYFEVLKS